MNCITILKPGLLTTVQDLGRIGCAALGLSRGGAADPLSLRVGNRLLGNPDAAAALECTLQGLDVRFEGSAAGLIIGAAALLHSGSAARALAPIERFQAAAGDILRIEPTSGARAYLCLAGGIDTPIVLGSRSAHLPSGIGGGVLREGDSLPIGALAGQPQPSSAQIREWLARRLAPPALRITTSAHTQAFAAADLQRLTGSEYQVLESSNRIGLRLAGPALSPAHGGRMITEPMPLGGIQIAENGQPILLLNDGPTTGGYPLIAAIAAVDLPACGQLRPRNAVRFQLISREESLHLLAAAEDELSRLLPAISP